MPKAWFHRYLQAAGEFATAIALSACAVYPAYGPRYGADIRLNMAR
jgi:hypothetical protein